MGPVAFPVRALEVKVGTQKVMHALRRLQHVGVGLWSRIVPAVVAARARQGGQRLIQGRDRGHWRRLVVRRVKRQSRSTTKWCAHQRNGLKNVRPDQCTPGRDRRTIVVANHASHPGMAEGMDQRQHILHEIVQAKRAQIGVVGIVPAGRASISPQVRCDHMKPQLCQRHHELAPAVGEFGKAVYQQDSGTRVTATIPCITGLEDMHPQAVHVRDEPGTNA